MTDEQKNTPSGTEQREENVDLYALFFKYFAYWPWFVASVLVCIISAFIYLRGEKRCVSKFGRSENI